MVQTVLNFIGNALSGFNSLDWVVALTLAISTVAAFMRGLVRSLFALVGIIAGIVLAGFYTPRFAKSITPWVTTPTLARLCAYVLILSAVYIVAVQLGRLVRGACSAAGLGVFDRLGGTAFGFLRAALLLAALLLPLSPYVPEFAVARSSILLPYLLPAAHGIFSVMPHDGGVRSPVSHWRTRVGQLAGGASLQAHP